MNYETKTADGNTIVLGDGIIIARFYGDGLYNDGALYAAKFVRDQEKFNEIIGKLYNENNK